MKDHEEEKGLPDDISIENDWDVTPQGEQK